MSPLSASGQGKNFHLEEGGGGDVKSNYLQGQEIYGGGGYLIILQAGLRSTWNFHKMCEGCVLIKLTVLFSQLMFTIL